jgi:hypothetical protein
MFWIIVGTALVVLLAAAWWADHRRRYAGDSAPRDRADVESTRSQAQAQHMLNDLHKNGFGGPSSLG